MPQELRYLWDWYSELRLGQRVGQVGLEPIGWIEIEAWARLTDQRPSPADVRALMALDAVTRFPGTFEGEG